MLSARLQSVSLRDLSLVLAVYRRGAFRPVARDMAISASGLSHQVRKVEEALNCVLFERGHSAVTPTAGGIALLAQIQRIVEEADSLQLLSKSALLPFGGRVRIAANTTIGPYLFPHLQRVFQTLFPDVTLELSEGMTQGPLRRLEGGDIDCLFSCLLPESTEIAASAVLEEAFTLLVHENLGVECGSLCQIAEQLGAGSVYFSEDIEVYGQPAVKALASFMTDSGQVRHPNLVPVGRISLETMASLAVANRAAVLLPDISISRLLTLSPLRAIKPTETPRRTIYALWRKRSPYHTHLTEMAQQLKELLPPRS